jgi:hypothetical protein
MLVTYVVQAVLITLYVPEHLAIRSDKVLTSKGRSCSCRQDVVSAAALYPGLSECFVRRRDSHAVGYTSLFLGNVRGRRMVLSAMVLSLLISFSSILSAAILQLAALNMLRRGRGRTMLWSLIGFLIIIIITLTFVEKQYRGHPSTLAQKKLLLQIEWEQLCLNEPGTIYLFHPALTLACLLLLGISGRVVSTLIVVAMSHTVHTVPERQDSPCWGR